MTTAIKPPPPHGTQARYKGTRTGSRPPCRCATCIRGNRRAGVERELRLLRGEQNRIPRDIILAHINKCTASGMSTHLIARRAGVAASTVRYLVTGRSQSCHHEKAARILAVQPNHFDNIAERPALGTTRRVQALYALGHSREAIAAASGLSQAGITQLAFGRYKTVDGTTALGIEAACRQLGETQGSNWKNRRRAAAEGWPPLAAWDDIDDPAARPYMERELTRDQIAELRRIDVEFLAGLGHTPEQIAERLGDISIGRTRDLVRAWRTRQHPAGRAAA